MLPVVHHPAYRADMPDGHRFPMDKFARLADLLLAEGVVDRFHTPEPIGWEPVVAVHDPAYARMIWEADAPREVERRIGLPITPSVAARSRAAVGGTLRLPWRKFAHTSCVRSWLTRSDV